MGAAKITAAQVVGEGMALKSPEASELRWFVLPSEALVALTERGAGTEPAVIERNEARPCVPLRGKVAENGCGEVGLQRRRLSGFEKFARAQQAALLLRQPQATFQVQIVLGPTVTEVSQLVFWLPSWCCSSCTPPSGFRHTRKCACTHAYIHTHTHTHTHTDRRTRMDRTCCKWRGRHGAI